MSLVSAIMPRTVRQRIDAWIALRNPAVDGGIVLHNRRLYILPTRFGYLYVCMLIVLLLAAINYSNSMAFALTFLLTAIGIVSLWQTHRNLLGLKILLKAPEAVYLGEKLSLEFELHNPMQNDRYAVGIQYAEFAPAYCRIDAGGRASVGLELPTLRRGQYRCDGFTLFTRYPTGLFHAWGWLRFNTPVMVYPRPDFSARLREVLDQNAEGDRQVDTADGDDFAGLREHRKGESLRHVSWKAYAQGRGLLTKTFQGQAAPALWIRWADIPAPSPEARLSAMTALIIQANRDGRVYGLSLPGITLEQSSGPAHYTRCLHQLAVFNQTDLNQALPIDES
jgi:uncharacterized protein (DUF58 family)